MRPIRWLGWPPWRIMLANDSLVDWPRHLRSPRSLFLGFSTREAACQWIARQEAR